MELKNDNPNGCNVVLKNLHPMALFFPKILKIEQDEGLQSLFESRKSIIAHNLKHLITFDSLIKVECIKAIRIYITLENQFQIFIFGKSDFLRFVGIAQLQNKQTYKAITFDLYFQMS